MNTRRNQDRISDIPLLEISTISTSVYNPTTCPNTDNAVKNVKFEESSTHNQEKDTSVTSLVMNNGVDVPYKNSTHCKQEICFQKDFTLCILLLLIFTTLCIAGIMILQYILVKSSKDET